MVEADTSYKHWKWLTKCNSWPIVAANHLRSHPPHTTPPIPPTPTTIPHLLVSCLYQSRSARHGSVCVRRDPKSRSQCEWRRRSGQRWRVLRCRVEMPVGGFGERPACAAGSCGAIRGHRACWKSDEASPLSAAAEISHSTAPVSERDKQPGRLSACQNRSSFLSTGR
ncbi:unnamed protein product [Pleuronectes platessa]|uniref:Uncharacterized protein n=1 Tax=Pleuronectes platessa TaxID=8262 RepID=A0A9N7ZCH7_PLEPL|nr:unnamed protein product [Pleuronectes platessa]